MRMARIFFLGLACGCLQLSSARAGTLRSMTLADLVQRADVIFVGTAVSSVSAWNPDHTRIYTHTTFQVEEHLKGHSEGTIVIETLGGVVGGIGMRAPGMPSFRAREKHLLFVKTGRVTGARRVVGWAQGDFRIHKDPHTGREMVSRDLGGVNLVGAAATGTTHDLDDLKDTIHRLKGR